MSSTIALYKPKATAKDGVYVVPKEALKHPSMYRLCCAVAPEQTVILGATARMKPVSSSGLIWIHVTAVNFSGTGQST